LRTSLTTAPGAGEGPQTPTASAEDRPQNSRQDADRLAKADDAAFAKARQAGTKVALTGYLKDYPQGHNVVAARAELTRLGFVEVAVDDRDLTVAISIGVVHVTRPYSSKAV
jgi:hypothetical protein